MSKRKGRRQPLTSEIKSVLRAPPDGELEPSQGPESDAADEGASFEPDAVSDGVQSEAETSDGAAPASAEALRGNFSLDEEPLAGADAQGGASGDEGPGARLEAVDGADTVRSDEPAAARRRGRRSRAGVSVETPADAHTSHDVEAPAASDIPAAEAEPFAEATAEDFAAAARAARNEAADDEETEESSAGERFAEPISLDDAGDDTEGFLRGLVEALLFTSQKPIDIKDLARSAGIDKPRARELIEQLRESYQGRGLCIEEIAGGFVMRSSPRYAPYIHKILALKPVRLSRAQLETLAIVAYRQPVTKPEVDDIRGVDSGQVIKGLLERGLLKMLGKKDEPGHPTLYGTTNEFLELLNLQSLKDLPTLREYTELSEESQRKFTEATGEAAPSDTMSFERPASEPDEATPAAEAQGDGRSEAVAEAPGGGEGGENPEADDLGAGRSQSDVVPIDDADLGDPEDVAEASTADDDDGDDGDDDDDGDDGDDDDDDADDDVDDDDDDR